MNTYGAVIFVIVLYIAYQVGRIKGRAEMFYQKKEKPGVKPKANTDKIEVAEYEEIK